MRIAFVCNPVAGGWSPLDPDAWAGGEEVAALLTAALARRGHAVSLFYDGPPLEHEGVQCLPREAAAELREAFDVSLLFKCPEQAGLRLAARQWLLTDQERPVNPDPFVRVVVCSEYLKRVYASLCPRAEEKLCVVPYGVDLSEMQTCGVGLSAVAPEAPVLPLRDPHLVLHASSPDRGLEPFLTYWPSVLEQRPHAKLLIAYGWELYDKYGGDPRLKARILGLLSQLPEGSYEMRRLSRQEMHRAFYRAGIWAYYCTGGEQFCLTALKAQIAGCVPVVKPWGAMHETVKSGLLAHNPADFVQALIRALDPEEQERFRGMVSSDHVQTWDRIAEQWETLFRDAESVVTPSEARLIPEAPAFGKPPGWNAPQVLANAIPQWLQVLQCRNPWIDPALECGRGPALSPQQADAVVVGWPLEDAKESPRDYLRALRLPVGTPVMVVSSFGTWRAGLRRRALSRRCLHDLFGQQPECLMNSGAVEGPENGFFMTTFRILPDRLGMRDLGRVRTHAAPRETLAACFIARNATGAFRATLDSIRPVVDQVCVIDTGSTDHTKDVVERFGKDTGIPVVIQDGTSPRYCFDCHREHALGEMGFGHRVAGFETPRNESIALAKADWILWLDCDEQLKHPERLDKYLRPNMFVGYGVQQHHHSMEPPEARKVDFPVRLFRRVVDKDWPEPMWFNHGEHEWPTFHPGLTARFTGIVHEHPGMGPHFTEGMGPVVICSDLHISHDGYLTEEIRRSRFVRNWPLMAADRQKYPGRRLGRFLWLRDLSHQARYLCEQNGGRLTQQAAELALEGIRVWQENFLKAADSYTPEAMGYAATCYAILGRGMETTVSIRVRRPEISGEEAVAIDFAGRFEDADEILGALKARLGETNRWTGAYV